MVDADPETDFIIIQLAVDIYGGRAADLTQQVTNAADVLCDKSKTLTKPIAVAIHRRAYPYRRGCTRGSAEAIE